jgi:hypothetical protein
MHPQLPNHPRVTLSPFCRNTLGRNGPIMVLEWIAQCRCVDDCFPPTSGITLYLDAVCASGWYWLWISILNGSPVFKQSASQCLNSHRHREWFSV